MFEKITPEQAGIQSENILKMLRVFKRKKYCMHSIVMAHNEKIFFEQYWEPYNATSLNRMYSTGKSFVSLAIGFLYDEGKIDLDDKIISYFPEYAEKAPDYIKEQTLRDMLKMSTSSFDVHWLGLGVKNRSEFYFTREQNRPSGTTYKYDSTGSYLLGIVVEKVTGMNFIDYLKEKLFRKIGVSEDICCLKTPDGHLWADSGVRCRSIDFLKVAQFATNMGMWNGEQLLSREYMEKATSGQVFNAGEGYSGYNKKGYGYQFFMADEDGFVFNGMGNQFAICIPKKNFVFICMADNQGNPSSAEVIFENVFEKIIDNLGENSLAENAQAYNELMEECKNLKLPYVGGELYSDFQKNVDGAVYKLNENNMKIESFTLNFPTEDEGLFEFADDEGIHKLPFGLGKNIFCKFPKNAMSNEVGGEEEEGYSHECAVSGAWVEEKKFFIKVQIIDKYLANLCITIGFREELAGVEIIANSEYIVNKYSGFAGGKRTGEQVK